MTLVRREERKCPAGKRHCKPSTSEDSLMCLDDDIVTPLASLELPRVLVPIPIPPPIQSVRLRPYALKSFPALPTTCKFNEDDNTRISFQACGRPALGYARLCVDHLRFCADNFAECDTGDYRHLFVNVCGSDDEDFVEDFWHYAGNEGCIAGLIDIVPAPMSKAELKEIFPVLLTTWSTLIDGHFSTAVPDLFNHWLAEKNLTFEVLLAPIAPPPPREPLEGCSSVATRKKKISMMCQMPTDNYICDHHRKFFEDSCEPEAWIWSSYIQANGWLCCVGWRKGTRACPL